ncbi:MAG: hypothetical protein ACR2OD_03195, partial [Gaiellaceae bacterium]
MSDELLLTASEWASMMRHPVRNRAYRLTPLGAKVADYLSWKELSGAAARTLETYEWVLARFAAHHPDFEVDAVTSEHLVTYLKGVSPPSRRLAASVLRDFFKWARQWQHIPANPMDLVPKMRQTPPK